jgi:ATP-binding cassette subfamily B (MDR/TAP) protein 1
MTDRPILAGSGVGAEDPEKIKEIKLAVQKKVDAYDPEAEQRDENLEFHETETVGIGVLYGRWASSSNICLLWFGLAWACAFGGALPGFCFFFGELIDDMGTMGKEAGGNPMTDNSINMGYIAVGAFVSSACYIGAMSVFSENVSYNMKIEYFRKALTMDAAFYDEQNPNEMASKINKEAGAIQRGTSEKIGTIAMSLFGFFLGFVVAFYFGWTLSLILLGGLPFVACSGVGWGIAMETGMVEQMKAYA